MTDTPPDGSWWQATDGKWYSPEQHPNYSPPQPSPAVPENAPSQQPWAVKKSPKWVPFAIVGLVAATALGWLVSLVVDQVSGNDSPTAMVTNADQTPTASLPRTPRPSATQAAQIESGVAAVYPGVPEGKATDWAVSTCLDILQGKTESQLLRNVQLRYSGGSRPDPAPAQAQAILDVIRGADFCR